MNLPLTDSSPDPSSLSGLLLDWYARYGRSLPWRAGPGIRPDPYRVWLSEIMLQQTTVATVIPYFEAFLGRWPEVQGLAAASLDEVLHAWQGLGYYARARNLHRCARTVNGELGGRFPDWEEGLRALPGIGPYTAAAIAAMAFGRKAVVVDGNVERVMARLGAIEETLPGVKPRLRERAAQMVPERRAGDFAQAVMDLGATVCTPRNPACGRCPWRAACVGHARGIAESLPRRAPRKRRPVRHGVAFWLLRDDGRLLLRRRPERGLLGGMMEVPSTPWRETAWEWDEAHREAPLAAEWRALEGVVRHTFTHFALELRVLVGTLADGAEADTAGLWHPPDRLAELALPTAMKKVARHVAASRSGPASTSGASAG